MRFCGKVSLCWFAPEAKAQTGRMGIRADIVLAAGVKAILDADPAGAGTVLQQKQEVNDHANV